jgi:hypothetical protein
MSCLLYTVFLSGGNSVNQSSRLYLRRMAFAAIVYSVLIIGTRIFLRDVEASPLRSIIALLPILPVGFGVFALLSFVRALDEMQRQIQLEAIAFSLGVTGMITFALGLVEEGQGSPISMTWVLPMMVAFWGIGLAIATRRYQ